MGTRLIVTVLGALGLAAASACTNGGPGTGIKLPTGAPEPAGSTYEPPGSGEEPAGSGSESAGRVRASGGELFGVEQLFGVERLFGVSGSRGGSDCPICRTYTCQATIAGKSLIVTYTLTPLSNPKGACSVQGQGVVLLCGGEVIGADGGATTGTWTSSGTSFSTSVDGVTFTCVAS